MFCGYVLDQYLLQVNLIIMLSFGSTESDRDISEPCYNEVAYNRHIVKYSFWEPYYGRVILKIAL